MGPCRYIWIALGTYDTYLLFNQESFTKKSKHPNFPKSKNFWIFSGFWIRGSLDESQEVELEGPLLLASTQEGVTNSQEEPKQTKEIILEPIEHTTLLLSSVEYQTESYQLEDLFSEDNDQSN